VISLLSYDHQQLVNVTDDLIGLNAYVRIIEITTHRDVNNEITKQDIVS
jgi:hypothetical protein